jgi:hypothetical protein
MGGWGLSSVLRQLMPALLLVLSATSVSRADFVFFRSAEECRAQPGPAAPSGHWVYRIDRSNHRRCWFLASGGLDAHRFGHAKLATHRDEPEATGDVQRAQDVTADLNVSPAITEPRTASAAEQPVAPQLAPPSPAPQPLAAVTIPTISYKRPSALNQEPFNVSVYAERSSGTSTIKPNFLADAAATILLLACGILYLAARIIRYQRLWAPHAARKIAGHRVPIIRSPSLAAELPSASEILERIRLQSKTPS